MRYALFFVAFLSPLIIKGVKVTHRMGLMGWETSLSLKPKDYKDAKTIIDHINLAWHNDSDVKYGVMMEMLQYSDNAVLHEVMHHLFWSSTERLKFYGYGPLDFSTMREYLTRRQFHDLKVRINASDCTECKEKFREIKKAVKEREQRRLRTNCCIRWCLGWRPQKS